MMLGAKLDVVLPKNSLTMTEAEIIEWLVPIGGQVVAGQPLFVMETEKSQVEVEAVGVGSDEHSDYCSHD